MSTHICEADIWVSVCGTWRAVESKPCTCHICTSDSDKIGPYLASFIRYKHRIVRYHAHMGIRERPLMCDYCCTLVHIFQNLIQTFPSFRLLVISVPSPPSSMISNSCVREPCTSAPSYHISCKSFRSMGTFWNVLLCYNLWLQISNRSFSHFPQL